MTILTKKQWEASVAEMWSASIKATYQNLIDEAVKAEREACAKLRDTLHPFDLHNRSEMLGVMNQGLDDYQNLIRARGQA